MALLAICLLLLRQLLRSPTVVNRCQIEGRRKATTAFSLPTTFAASFPSVSLFCLLHSAAPGEGLRGLFGGLAGKPRGGGVGKKGWREWRGGWVSERREMVLQEEEEKKQPRQQSGAAQRHAAPQAANLPGGCSVISFFSFLVNLLERAWI